MVGLLRDADLLRKGTLQKSRGQNFLKDADCARRIARCCDVGGCLNSSLVIEIGAGAGALTRALFGEGARRIVAIESDVRLANFLKQWGAELEEDKVLEVVEADARKLDYAKLLEERGRTKGEGCGGDGVVVVGNLPYSVGTVILRKLLEDVAAARGVVMVLMFQREVADRIAAGVGDAAYGRLSVLVGLRCRVERCFDVAPSSFVPVPSVVSCVLRFLPRNCAGGGGGDGELGECCVTREEYDFVGEMTGLFFSYRRKRLSTILRMAGKDDWGGIGEDIGVDCSRRAGEVGVGEWLRWARAVMAAR